MFEYIKRVSIAISFIAQKVDGRAKSVKDILESLSLDLLLLAQSFKDQKYKYEDLHKLESKISYLVDVVDYARISQLISTMNASVFVDSQLAFLKHIRNLIEQTNSLSLPLYQLKELDEFFARKSAKENLQHKFNFDFSDNSDSEKSETKENLSYKNIQTENQPEVPTPKTEKQNDVEAPKKILEESILYPVSPTISVETVEREIDERRKRILNALTQGGGSIREIASKMPDVNEKTIQRDLLELMRDKKVIMLGKKRWAKYYLK